jgi:hypothetical protein
VHTCYEPINWGSNSDGLWIGEIMCKFGFCSGDKFARTTAFNAARRTAAKTNWAVTSFIGYNPSPAPDRFRDGRFAYAYINGPYSQLLFRNDGWAVSQYDLVNAHETGHLFGARDQYGGSGCNNCFTPGNNDVFNGNCVNCNSASVPSIMRNNELALDGYCPGQIGWAVLINHVRPVGEGGVAKSNWVPGQAVDYRIQFQLPGRPSSLGSNSHTVTSRWFVQFPGGVTQSHGPFTTTVTTDNTWNLTLTRTIPSVAFGEATLEVFIEVSNYGKGGRASLKSSFYIAGAGANPIPSAPTPEENAEPVAALR